MLLFNRYEYNPGTDLVGKGSFSRVYKALDKETNDWVAVKLYKSGPMHKRSLSEAAICSLVALEHPNIHKCVDIKEIEKEDAFGETESIQVFVTAFENAGNAKAYYTANKDLEQLKKIITDVIKGLDFLHSNNIIHKHLRPSNILVNENNNHSVTGKISDCSINFEQTDHAQDIDTSSSLTIAIPYLAPEQLSPQRYGINGKVSANIDIWQLGLSIYEIITGEILFKPDKRESSEQVMKKILDEDLPEQINNVPEPFSTFIKKCLIKDANLRAQHAGELLLYFNQEDTAGTLLNEEEMSFEHTAVLTISQRADNSDHTQIIMPVIREYKTIAPMIADTDIEMQGDTQIISKAKINSNTSDDTQLIKPALTGEVVERTPEVDNNNINITETVTTVSTDDTQIIVQELLQKGNIDDTTPLAKKSGEGSIVLFNRYEYLPVTDLIGKGGFSRVYKAYDKKLNRWVALKIYKTNDLSERYSPFAEIRRVINLDHGNICRYLDIEEIENVNPFGETEKIQVCVMELLDSGNIAEYYKAHPDPDVLKKLLADVLKGLAYLHKKGIIHRDIKPANILIKESIEGPVAKITDFGISKASDTVNNNSSSALIVSIPFMAPEQFNTKKYGIDEKISFNLDLWSLGVTIYEVYTGKVLFKDSEQDNSEQIMANIMAPELPDKINRLPEPFKNIVSHCLVKDAKQRAQKAEELIDLLNKKTERIYSTTYYTAERPNGTKQNDGTSEPDTIIPFSSSKKTDTSATEASITQPLKRSFSFEEEPVKEKKQSRIIRFNYKRASIIAGGALLLLLYFVFIKKFMKENSITGKPNNKNTVIPKPVDTTAKTIAATSDSLPQNDSLRAEENSSKNIDSTEQRVDTRNKKKDTDAETKQKIRTAESKKKAKGIQKFQLELTTTEACKLILNNQPYTDLSPGSILKTQIDPGIYTLKAISSESSRIYNKIITVKASDIGNSTRISINF